MKTLRQFFEIYKSKLPYRYDTFHKFYKTDEFMEELAKNNIIHIGGSEKRKTYKIIDDEEFKKAIFNLKMGGMK